VTIGDKNTLAIDYSKETNAKIQQGSKVFMSFKYQKIHRNVGFESILAFVNLALMVLVATISKRLVIEKK